MSTDKGPDQKGAGTLIDAETYYNEKAWVFRCWCIEHGMHLEVQDTLKLTPGYFAIIAKLVNCWRAGTTARTFYKRYAENHGDAQARTVVGKLPGRPLRIRWGSIHTSEAYLLQVGRADCIDLFESLATKHNARSSKKGRSAKAKRADAAATSKTSAAASAAVEDDADAAADAGIDDETPKSYSAKLGRWRKESIDNVKLVDTWVLMHTHFVCRGPIQHVRFWNQSKAAAAERVRPKAVEYICDRVHRALREWEHIMAPDTDQYWRPIVDLDDDTHRENASSRALLVVQNCVAGFYRRLVAEARFFPCLFAWFVWSPHDVPCTARKSVATNLLDPELASRSNDRTTMKVLAVCRSEVEHISEYGTITLWFYELWVDIFEEWSLDTGDIEGNNNVVKRHIKIAANIGWRLLSRRLISRNRILSLPHGNQALDEFVSECVAHHPQTLASMTPADEMELFGVVGEDYPLDDDCDPLVPPPPPPLPLPKSPELRLAARYHVQLVEQLADLNLVLKPSTAYCIRIHCNDTDLAYHDPFLENGSHWFVSKVFRKQAWCLRADTDDTYDVPAVRAVFKYELCPLLSCLENAVREAGQRGLEVEIDIVLLKQDFRLYGTSSVITGLDPVLLARGRTTESSISVPRASAAAPAAGAAGVVDALDIDAVEEAVLDEYGETISECSELGGEDRDICYASDIDDEDSTRDSHKKKTVLCYGAPGQCTAALFTGPPVDARLRSDSLFYGVSSRRFRVQLPLSLFRMGYLVGS